MEPEYDYIIVGQGLAGSCLALELKAKGKKIMVYNTSEGNSSSRVAGGLINPITGRKMVLTWKAKQLFAYLEEFYKSAELTLEASFFNQIPIYRPFISIEEQNEWQGKSVDPEFKPFIKEVLTKSEAEGVVNNPFGGLVLNRSGFLDTNSFLDSTRNWLNSEGRLLNEKFDVNSLNFIQNGVVYKGIEARRVVFCDGVEGVNNPYFSEVKYRPVKGEILKIKIDPVLNKVYNRGVFVMPREEHHTVGSNYNHKDLSWETTERGKKEVEEKLKALLVKPYKIVDHIAGVRPSVSDRRPVLGRSKAKDQLIIFNGLGTKGVSLAPFFANQLANWLCDGQEIDKEVNVNRYY